MPWTCCRYGLRSPNGVWWRRMPLSLGRGCNVSARSLNFSSDLKNEAFGYVQFEVRSMIDNVSEISHLILMVYLAKWIQRLKATLDMPRKLNIRLLTYLRYIISYWASEQPDQSRHWSGASSPSRNSATWASKPVLDHHETTVRFSWLFIMTIVLNLGLCVYIQGVTKTYLICFTHRSLHF